MRRQTCPGAGTRWSSLTLNLFNILDDLFNGLPVRWLRCGLFDDEEEREEEAFRLQKTEQQGGDTTGLSVGSKRDSWPAVATFTRGRVGRYNFLELDRVVCENRI